MKPSQSNKDKLFFNVGGKGYALSLTEAIKISSFIDCQHCRMEGNSLSYSCRPTGLHGTMRLSLFAWICIRGLQIYHAMALFKFSSRSSARHSGAQLRLAPNRPCMTLVIGASLNEPHIDDINACNPYIMFIIILYVWYVRHVRTAIDIVQRCAVYFKRPHENICVSIVTCFFDTLNYFSEFRHFFWPLYYDYTYSLLQF